MENDSTRLSLGFSEQISGEVVYCRLCTVY
jgi:hypothetical protein